MSLARQCVLDWFGVSLAACDDPLVRILADEALEEGGKPRHDPISRSRPV